MGGENKNKKDAKDIVLTTKSSIEPIF